MTALTDAGYADYSAADGEEGYFLGDTEPYDIVILDIGLPKMDGISVLEQWRRANRVMPVIILTARDRWSDKVAGMDAGADDYLAKPFHMEELLARVRAQVRRASGHAKSEIECGPLRLDITDVGPRVVTAGGPDALSVVGTLTNTGDRPVDELVVRVQRGQPLRTEGQLRDALDGSAATDAVTPQFTELPGELAPGGQVQVRLSVPLRGAPRDLEVWSGTGGHGGGDEVMLRELFGKAEPDKYLRAADERSGLYSILIGAAANRGFVTGQAVSIADLVKGLTPPSVAPMPNRSTKLSMPVKA